MGTGQKSSKAPATGTKETKEPPQAAPEVKPPQAALDFSALDEAYEHAAIVESQVMNTRAIGVREVLGNLNETDPPSLTDELIKSLAVAALGFASAGVTTAIAGKLVPNLANTLSGAALNSAIQTAFDDGAKDAATKVAGYLTRDTGTSKASFFASQEEGLEGWKSVHLKKISTKKKEVKQHILATGPDHQASQLSEAIRGAKDYTSAASATAEDARQIQYENSLVKWMSALAQGKLGTKNGGANLEDAVDMSPESHYTKRGTEGVIYVALGQHPARRPFAVTGKRGGIRVAGMTKAARDRIKNVPLRDLNMPIVVSGFIYDGFFDGISVVMGDNEIAFGRNENGHVWVEGHGDAMDGLKQAAGKSSAGEAAKVILEQDIGASTLAHAVME